MKFRYDELEDKFYVGKKEIKPSHKDFMTHVCKYAIRQVSKGESLADLFPLESDVAPPLADILDHIESSKPLIEEMAKADKNRLAIMSEKLIKVSDEYRARPDAENKDVFAAVEKTYTSLRRSSEESGNVILKFHQTLPDNFWDVREIVAPENPRNKED